MGMRHMLVTDKKNRTEGMITRKDLIPFNLTRKLERALECDMDDKKSDRSEDIPSITKQLRMEEDGEEGTTVHPHYPPSTSGYESIIRNDENISQYSRLGQYNTADDKTPL